MLLTVLVVKAMGTLVRKRKYRRRTSLGYLRDAQNLRSGIIKSEDVARGELAWYYGSSFQRTRLRIPRQSEFCGIFNEWEKGDTCDKSRAFT